MLNKIFKFLDKSKERRAVMLTLKLRRLLIDMDFHDAADDLHKCTSIEIIEWDDSVASYIEITSTKNYLKRIRLDKNGKIINI